MPDRRLVDVGLVRRLIATQFPQWARLPIRPVEISGWDNQTFRLGDRMSIRLPTAREYALAVDKEHRWLPLLAPRVPLPISKPLATGRPGEEFAFPWSVYEWIDADPARIDTIADLTGFADSLAAFLVALRHVDATGGPEPGLHNWFRGGPLRVYDAQTRRAIEVLDGHVPRDAVTAVWQSALQTTWDRQPVWFHGDVALGNLLVRDGALAAVIDFGTCGVGDPACDLVIAWTRLTGVSREAFRARVDVDPGTWARGRGWALWKALIIYARALHDDPAAAAEVKRVIDEVLTEYAESGPGG
ncbi:aminoglycoside phosphotransferase family protein [Longispora fulva]|uniref:Aminoglycoside phosphotransferase (APT) family kinase protein n=1 Tax=Longispora fulva TaxID=619741 RepID=A0A8J7GE62_9ACTN|nr:aminoglycoside phosphotransferase family protein [Longispora fulva]MBG6136210.1 aminoglycoside phosphotransferase (APT) family kinase protein [Longispora fulva]